MLSITCLERETSAGPEAGNGLNAAFQPTLPKTKRRLQGRDLRVFYTLFVIVLSYSPPVVSSLGQRVRLHLSPGLQILYFEGLLDFTIRTAFK